MTSAMPELGFYTLAGAAHSPRDLIGEVRMGEELGLGHVFISERWNVKEAATLAGRDPDGVKVWSVFATIGDHLPEEVRLKKTVGRLATYLQMYGDLMVETNRWDPAVLARFRADEVVAGFGSGLIDAVATTKQLEHIATLLPDEWLAPAATGSPQQCAAAVRAQFALGADGVILHGATPTELAPIVTAYRT